MNNISCTCTKIFCNNIRLSFGVKSLFESLLFPSFSDSSGRSKKRYKHLTRVEGTETSDITCNNKALLFITMFQIPSDHFREEDNWLYLPLEDGGNND